MMPANFLDDFPAPLCQTGADGALKTCNRAWLDFTGQPLEAHLGFGWSQSIHPEDREGSLGVYSQAVAGCIPFENEYRLRRWDGEYRWVLDIGRPFFDDEHHFGGYVRICYDNTGRQLSGDSLRRLSRHLELQPESGRRSSDYERRDEIGPALMALLIHLAMLQTKLGRVGREAQQHIRSALNLVQFAVDALGDPESEGSYPVPDKRGLNLALMSYCDEATAQYNIPINYSGVEIPLLNSETAIAMMHLLQDGLANARACAQANRISVALDRSGKLLRLTVEDNGNGKNILPLAQASEYGADAALAGMVELQQQFTKIGGRIEADFQFGRGGCLTGILPI